MANRIAGNCYIIDGTGVLSWLGGNAKIQSILFYSTDTTGELQIAMAENTLNIVHWVRNNNNQAYTLPTYLGGVSFGQLRVMTLTTGTGFIYFV